MRALIAILALVAGLVLAARLLWAEYDAEEPRAVEVEVEPAPEPDSGPLDRERETDASPDASRRDGPPEDAPPLRQEEPDETPDADDAGADSPDDAGQPPREAPLPPVEEDSPYRPLDADEADETGEETPADDESGAEGGADSAGAPADLIIPVEGVEADELYDSWNDARGEERSHQGLDIHAEAGTPVLAAADGEIVKFFDSVPGGTTIYQMSEDKDFIYYYAHLQKRENGLSEGDAVSQGDVIGYVGSSGNAGETPHLHFEIQRSEDGESWWRGDAINPFDVLSGEAPLRRE